MNLAVALVRHTEADVAPGRCYGRLDLGLSAAGELSARALARKLAGLGIARVHASPARRCRALAGLLTSAALIDDRLQELHFGAWEGRSWDEVPRDALDAWAADPGRVAPPGGETGAALIRRVESFCADLLSAGEDAVVIAHGGPLKLMRAVLVGDAPDLLAAAPPLGSVTMLSVQPEIAARRVNTAHSVTTAQAPSTSPVKPPI